MTYINSRANFRSEGIISSAKLQVGDDKETKYPNLLGLDLAIQALNRWIWQSTESR
jgi:hypothetical protein